MRPVLLTMKAFGSFARETTVRFTDLASGLYLIVGETGAGKTTIFDAIVFALFGAASGTNRKPDMMHSDYVDKSEDTKVVLTFEQGGRLYTVIRTIHFRKKRGTENEYGDGILDAVLSLPEETPVKGHALVTKRCEELLGLNADQFRKIVMLAQGEFREFLQADAAKKSDILGRLFDSSEYIRYQTLLSMSRNALAERRKQYRETVDTVMNTIFRAPEQDEESDDTMYLPGNPQLIDNLNRLMEADTQKAGELAAQKASARKAVDAVNTKMGRAKSDNQKLDELSAAREHAQKLDEQREEMARFARQYALAEKALHRVSPAQEKWQLAKKAADRTSLEMAELQERISVLTAARDQAQRVMEEDEEVKRTVLGIVAEEQKLADSFPRYDLLAEKLPELKREQHAAAALRTRLADAEKRKKKAEETLERNQEEFSALENADAEAARAEARYESAKEKAAVFGGGDGIARGVRKLCREENELQREEETLSALSGDASEAEREYHQAYQMFISGQSGLLALELEKELNETGSAVCPVCHSAFCAGQKHAFAPYVEGTPTQAEVDQAKARFEQCEKKRSERFNSVEKLRATLTSRKDTLLDRAKKLLPDCDSWEMLADEDYLSAASARFAREETETRTACENAARKQVRRTELKEQCEKLAAEASALTRKMEQDREALGEAEKELAAWDAEIRALRSALPYETREEAESKQKELSDRRAELNAQLDAHQKAFHAAKEALDQAQGELTAKETVLPEQRKAEAEAGKAFLAALDANGFADPADWEAALAPVDEADREGWLTRRQEAVNIYRNDCENTQKRIRELAEQTEGLRYTDLEELKQQLAETEKARDAAENACAEQNELLKNHEDVRRRAAAALAELDKTNDAWERLDRLAELALGASSEGGKLSFERYVMGSIFREVLNMANRRLDTMSGGRYALVHTIGAARSNSVAGLEIEVLDAATGKQRPANSLSGGESFQVSLSLALGLSDVVQSRAGGIGLDTIFIDEGFGALDSGALDNAIAVLNQLTEGNRLVGIISHVDKLEESIPQKLRVKKTAHGSELKSELS